MLAFHILAFMFLCTANANEVEKVFKEHAVVPDVIPQAPNEFLMVTYDNGLQANAGNELTPTQVQNQPELKWSAESDAYYTIILCDPDAPSRAEPKFRQYKHWIVANVPSNNIAEGEVIADYIGSGPPKGTGLHRYVFLVYKQSGKLDFAKEVRTSKRSRLDRPKFSVAKFAEQYGLGQPIAGNFYQAQYDDYVPILQQQLSEN